MLTRRGKTLVLVGAAAMVVGLGLGAKDVTRTGVLLLTLCGLAWLAGKRGQAPLQVTRVTHPGTVSARHPCRVELTLRHDRGGRTSTLWAHDQVPYALGDAPRFLVPPIRAGEARRSTYDLVPRTRGIHQIGPLVTHVRDAFGITEHTRAAGAVGELIVLPEIVALDASALRGLSHGTQGSVPHVLALHGDDDVSVREFRDGDDLRRVHWPASARIGDLMVRQEERPARHRLVVVVDARPTGGQSPRIDGSDSGLEWRVSAAASILAAAAAEGFALHVLLPDPSRDGHARHLLGPSAYLYPLAALQPDPSDSLPALATAAADAAGDGGVVIALVTAMDHEAAATLSAAKAIGSAGIAFVVADPSNEASDTSATFEAAAWRSIVVSPERDIADAWRLASEFDAQVTP